jgi:hypothetical protein
VKDFEAFKSTPYYSSLLILVVQIVIRKYFITKNEQEFDPLLAEPNPQGCQDLGSFIKVCSIQVQLMGVLACQVKEMPPAVYSARIVASIRNPRPNRC